MSSSILCPQEPSTLPNNKKMLKSLKYTLTFSWKSSLITPGILCTPGLMLCINYAQVGTSPLH